MTDTPNDDDREALAKAYATYRYRGVIYLSEYNAAVGAFVEGAMWSPAGFRRSEVPEPISEDYKSGKLRALGGGESDMLCPECQGELTSWFCDPCGNTGKVLFVGAPSPDLDDLEALIVRAIYEFGKGWNDAAGTDQAASIAAALRAAGVVR